MSMSLPRAGLESDLESIGPASGSARTHQLAALGGPGGTTIRRWCAGKQTRGHRARAHPPMWSGPR